MFMTYLYGLVCHLYTILYYSSSLQSSAQLVGQLNYLFIDYQTDAEVTLSIFTHYDY